MKKVKLICATAAMMTCAYASNAASEGWLDPIIDKRTNIHFVSDKSKLRSKIVDLKERGRIVIDIETYQENGCKSPVRSEYDCRRYLLISAKNVGNLFWDLILPYDQAAYIEQWQEFERRNFRLADMENDGLVVNSITALFVQNSQNLKWASYPGLSRKRFKEEYKKRVTDGNMTLIDHEVYEEGAKKRHAAIFAVDKSRRFTLPSWRLSTEEYATLATIAYDQDSLRPLYMNTKDSFTASTYYSTFIRDNSTEAKVFTSMTRQQLSSRNTNLKQKGYRIVDIEIGTPGLNSRWRATWVRKKKP